MRESASTFHARTRAAPVVRANAAVFFYSTLQLSDYSAPLAHACNSDFIRSALAINRRVSFSSFDKNTAVVVAFSPDSRLRYVAFKSSSVGGSSSCSGQRSRKIAQTMYLVVVIFVMVMLRYTQALWPQPKPLPSRGKPRSGSRSSARQPHFLHV